MTSPHRTQWPKVGSWDTHWSSPCPSNERKAPRARHEEAERRRRLRDRATNPAFFVAAPSHDPAQSEVPISAFSGRVFLAVRRDHAEAPLRDPEARIGVCDFHPLPNNVRAEDNPCPYQLACYFVSQSPEHLRQTICSEVLAGTPGLSRKQLSDSLDRNWRVVRLEANEVRWAWLLDDPRLQGGEPQLRRDSQYPRTRNDVRWARIREMLDRDVAVAVIRGDPENQDRATRIFIFTLPGLSLTQVKALRWGKPVKFSDFDRRRWTHSTSWLRQAGSTVQRAFRILADCYFIRKRSRRRLTELRRDRRKKRRREAAEKWAVRGLIVAEMRGVVALVRETAETTILVAKAALLLVVVIGGSPAAALVVIELLRHA